MRWRARQAEAVRRCLELRPASEAAAQSLRRSVRALVERLRLLRSERPEALPGAAGPGRAPGGAES